MGKVLVVVGLAIAALGALAHFGLLRWFGHLPGDLRYESGGTRIYVPITSMLIVSAVLSLASWIARKL
jgi:hypothetical protein